jgi:Fe-S cluster assembly ATPase SufC
VPDTTEVGYDLRGNEGRLVARREVEVDFGGGIRKRYEVVAPIVA